MKNFPGSNEAWRGKAALRRILLLPRLVQHLPNPLIPDCVCSGITFDVSVCMEDKIEGKMESELGELESSSTSTVLKHLDSSVSLTGR